jgi:hypothetical protein
VDPLLAHHKCSMSILDCDDRLESMPNIEIVDTLLRSAQHD